MRYKKYSLSLILSLSFSLSLTHARTHARTHTDAQKTDVFGSNVYMHAFHYSYLYHMFRFRF